MSFNKRPHSNEFASEQARVELFRLADVILSRGRLDSSSDTRKSIIIVVVVVVVVVVVFDDGDDDDGKIQREVKRKKNQMGEMDVKT